jgi:iron complex outermembrane receptor protein
LYVQVCLSFATEQKCAASKAILANIAGMNSLKRYLFSISLQLMGVACLGQTSAPDTVISIRVMNNKQPYEGATVELLKAGNNSLVKAGLTDAAGEAIFRLTLTGEYSVRVSATGFLSQTTPAYKFPLAETTIVINLVPAGKTLQGVTVATKKPFIERLQGKLVVNVDAAITNAGTTVLEVLEKSPGVMVDKNGSISLQGKSGVMVMIDDKQTYLSGTDLNNLLSSMSSSQVEQIELITSPSAKYDASGNAGIINIKTKKNKQKGFNGSFNVFAGQGFYPKHNHGLQLNYRNGKFNTFLNYSMNLNKYLTDIYALRKYYAASGNVTGTLDQPTFYNGTSKSISIKAGADYFASAKTTLGIVVTAFGVNRKGKGDATATWLNANGAVDSAILTYSNSANRFRNAALNLNFKHVVDKKQEFSADFDWANYDINNKQYFNNRKNIIGGYNEASQGDLPSSIHIISAKADHVLRPGKESKLESGLKTSHISTDNLAVYQIYNGAQWKDDYNKSNHFLYTENIHAAYSSFETKHKKLSVQAGLRYENTSYQAKQLGNVMKKDSSFSRNYSGLFPSGYISYQLDSSNSLTFTTGRRIDRPAFQKLNPFITIINKYTYQTGNPFFLPQLTWNMELTHQYKQLLITSVSYNIVKNYFSQLFLTDTSGILIYSEGNVGRTHNFGASVMVQATPFKFWSLTSQAIFNHKQLKGVNYSSSIKQLNLSMNNQFRIGKIYTAELSGTYTTRARNDLQELLYPTGQLLAGVSRPVLKKKGTLKLTMRDIFYTQAMEGFTTFQSADEYFIVRRDSRMVSLVFTYRFGKAYKSARRNSSSASDEMQRVGNGN